MWGLGVAEEGQAPSRLPTWAFAHAVGWDARATEAGMSGMHNGNAQTSAHKATHRGIGPTGFGSEMEGKSLEDFVGFLGKEPIS